MLCDYGCHLDDLSHLCHEKLLGILKLRLIDLFLEFILDCLSQ